MSEDFGSYWSRYTGRRYDRRAVLRGIALGGAGLAGGAALACNSRPGPVSKAAQTQAPNGGTASSLVGRTGSPVPAGETPVRGGTYVNASGANPQGFDPQSGGGLATLMVAGGVMSKLLQPKSAWDPNEANNKAIAPDLALVLESPDAITWTVKLRPGARFHNIPPVNGHAVEAEDVRVSFQRGLMPAMPSSGGLSMIDPSQIQTPDANTVVFKLKYPFASFPNILSGGRYGTIYPREVAGGGYNPKTNPIGSGPFILESYTPDVAIIYRRNPDYYDKQLPYIDALKTAIIPDPSQQLAQFTAGQIDELRAISQSDISTFQKQNPAAETISNWGGDTGLIYYRVPDPASPFQDIRLRQAMSLSLDRDALSTVAYDGKSIPTFYSPPSFGKWSLKMEQLPPETAQWYKFDPARARQLVAAAGAAGLNVTYLSPTPFPSTGEYSFFKVMREATFTMLQALPWKINLVLLDSAREWSNSGKGVRYGNFAPDAAIWGGLEGFADTDDYIYSWYGSQSSLNIGRLKDETLDAMILKGRSIIDEDDRLRQYLDIQKYLAAQMYSVAGNPYGLNHTMVNQRVGNYLLSNLTEIGTGTFANLWLKK